jgi:hypothetical protein
VPKLRSRKAPDVVAVGHSLGPGTCMWTEGYELRSWTWELAMPAFDVPFYFVFHLCIYSLHYRISVLLTFFLGDLIIFIEIVGTYMMSNWNITELYFKTDLVIPIKSAINTATFPNKISQNLK